MKKLLFILALIPLCSFGQGDGMTSVMYSVAIPMGTSADYIGETSFRGFAVTGDYFLDDEWSLGFSTGVQTFYEELGTQSYSLETLTVTGEEFRYINMIPAIMMGKYHFDRYGVVTPHIGFGAGFHWVDERREFAGFQFEESSFRFGIQPEAGVGFEISPSTDLLFVSTYHQSFESKNLQAHSFLAFQLGLRWLP
jgi:opacity protein-like surface antigen